jgi:hypothetical protein
MNNEDRNAEEIATGVPPQQQKEVDSSSRMVIEEEGGGQEREEGAQHTATGRERGKYRQYEDSQVIIEKIRSYRTQRYPDSEIMKILDNMPRRTYYNHIKKLQEQDMQIMKQWMAENVEHVSEEMMIYRETLCQKLREIQAIIENENTSAKDKMRAIDQYLAVLEKLVNFIEKYRFNSMKLAEEIF